ncbi:OmpP1/FadL family transporter [Rhizosphaericola mali]|uniref:Long-chain fatty acid transporter n=1 Tax=Rhizosphaericola mali TaxID=2545455 RepID=A0A5P2G1U1_9BACT|nr:outer membrane protein transport protein [Rhizosphaericola mali]QES89415.1 long-chain fatty acid transporter [Rhizosphaericola mali]
MKKLILSLVSFVPMAIFAQGYQLNLQSVKQSGMGGVGAAGTLNATSLYYNPGSSAFLEQNSIAAGVSGVASYGTFTDKASGNETKASNPFVTPFNANILLGNPAGRIRYGLSIYTPFGSTMKWNDNFTGHYEITKISLISVAFQPTVSFKVTDHFGIGAGFVYGYGHITLDKDLPINESDGSFATGNISTKANSYGYNIGAYYKFSEKFSIGATYRSALKMKANNGKADFDVPASLASQFPDQKITARLPLPNNWTFGVKYTPNNKWMFAADFMTSNWKPYDTITIHYTEQTANLTDTKLVRLYKRGYSYRLGAQYTVDDQWQVRAGISYNKSPIPNDLVNPDVPDANRVIPSVGLSFRTSNKFVLDASFLYEHIKRSGENRLSHINGDYKFNLFIPSVGFTYQL